MVTRVTIAGSRRLPRGHASRLLVLFLASLPDNAVIALRRGRKTEPGPFEREVEHLARALGFEVEWWSPSLLNDYSGRATTFVRDGQMAEASSLVLAFMLPEEAMGEGGTSHLVIRAIDLRVPVYTYTLDETGRVSRLGENDPDGEWEGRVPLA